MCHLLMAVTDLPTRWLAEKLIYRLSHIVVYVQAIRLQQKICNTYNKIVMDSSPEIKDPNLRKITKVKSINYKISKNKVFLQ